jgi:hypothetical protein
MVDIMNNKALLIAGTVVAGVSAVASLVALLDIEVVVEKPAPKRKYARSSSGSTTRRTYRSSNSSSSGSDGFFGGYGGFSAPSYSPPSSDSFGGGSFDGGGSSASY